MDAKWEDFWKVMEDAQNEIKSIEAMTRNLKVEKKAASQKIYDDTIVAYARDLNQRMSSLGISYIGAENNLILMPESTIIPSKRAAFMIRRDCAHIIIDVYWINTETNKSSWRWCMEIFHNDTLDNHRGEILQYLRTVMDNWDTYQPYITAGIKNALCHQLAERSRTAMDDYNKEKTTKY